MTHLRWNFLSVLITILVSVLHAIWKYPFPSSLPHFGPPASADAPFNERIVACMPTVMRPGGVEYVTTALRSFREATRNHRNLRRLFLFVMDTDPASNRMAAQLERASMTTEGEWLQVLPRQNAVNRKPERMNHGDSFERVQWRSKEALDYVQALQRSVASPSPLPSRRKEPSRKQEINQRTTVVDIIGRKYTSVYTSLVRRKHHSYFLQCPSSSFNSLPGIKTQTTLRSPRGEEDTQPSPFPPSFALSSNPTTFRFGTVVKQVDLWRSLGNNTSTFYSPLKIRTTLFLFFLLCNGMEILLTCSPHPC